MTFSITSKGKPLINMAYLVFDKFIRLGVGIIVFALMAKKFGPEVFGELNYAFSYVYIFLAISTLGMQSVIVRDLVIGKVEKSEILGTSIVIRIASSVFLYPICVFTYLKVGNRVEENEIILISILSSLILFSYSDVFKYWFESNVISKYAVITENIVFFIISSIKIVALLTNVSFDKYIILFAIEPFIMCILLYSLFKRYYRQKWFKYDYSYAKRLLKDSLPLLIASAAWVLYTRIDVIFIGSMLESSDVGNYAIATKISDIFGFIPIVIVSSYVPLLQKINEHSKYEQGFQSLYNRVTLVMIIISILTVLLSEVIITSVFGADFIDAKGILDIYIWGGVFNALAIISGRYLLLKGLQHITMYRHAIGLAINCPLNYIMINNFGLQGAAIATVISLFISNFILDLCSNKTRHVFMQKIKSLLMLWLIKK